jgi:hypothetical protein
VNMIMVADLHTERESAMARLELVRVSDIRMRITMTGVDTSHGRTSETQQRAIEFDINTVRLIPRYAMPGRGGDGFGVLIKTEAITVDLKFSRIEDALRFQQAVTGFKAYENYSEGPVAVLLENDQKLIRRAVFQLWVHEELVGRPDMASSPISPRAELSRISSDTMTPYRTDSMSAQSARNSAWSTLTKVKLENGTSGWFHSQPKKPMLVLFLQDESADRRGDGYSFLTVKLDLLTDLAPERCNCRLDCSRYQPVGDYCTHAIIGRSDKKSLQAEIYESENFLDWDVNRLGLSGRQRLPRKRLHSLTRICFKFGPPGSVDAVDRRKYFAGSCVCRPRKAAELAACLAKHKSLFREVKELGRRRLMSWGHAMNSRKEILTGEAAIRALQDMENT